MLQRRLAARKQGLQPQGLLQQSCAETALLLNHLFALLLCPDDEHVEAPRRFPVHPAPDSCHCAGYVVPRIAW